MGLLLGTVSVHDRRKLPNPEKITDLQLALKDGTAKQMVEGLSSSGDQYTEAIECLRKRFERPHLLNQTNVRAILEAPFLKEGHGRELRRHSVVQLFVASRCARRLV